VLEERGHRLREEPVLLHADRRRSHDPAHPDGAGTGAEVDAVAREEIEHAHGLEEELVLYAGPVHPAAVRLRSLLRQQRS
jgi:hypothetical protein